MILTRRMMQSCPKTSGSMGGSQSRMSRPRWLARRAPPASKAGLSGTRMPVAVTQEGRSLRRRAAVGLGLFRKLPRIAVLLELRDDVVGDREPLLLGQPPLETANDPASTQQA